MLSFFSTARLITLHLSVFPGPVLTCDLGASHHAGTASSGGWTGLPASFRPATKVLKLCHGFPGRLYLRGHALEPWSQGSP